MSTLVLEHIKHADTAGPNLSVDSSGNIGIGTTTPSTSLHVKTTSSTSITTEGFAFGAPISGKIEASAGNVFFAGSTTNHSFGFLTNNLERMRVDTSGNVGIGTTTPNSKVDITGSSTTEVSLRVGNTEPTEDSLGVFFSTGSAYNYIGIGGGETAVYGRTGLVLAADNPGSSWKPIRFSTGGSEKMRITSAGSVGIGTTEPDETLHVRTFGNSEISTQYGTGLKARLGAYSNAAAVHLPSVSVAFSVESETGATDTLNLRSDYLSTTYKGLRMDAFGRVMTPHQPAFVAYSLLGQGSLSGVDQVFPFDLVFQRGGSNYNTSTNRFTAPIAGWYYFVAQIYRNGSSSATRFQISKNGASIFNANINHNGSGTDETVQHIVLVDMAANDYVDVRQADAGTYNFWRGHSTFVGYLLG